jgi:hypothetical protein
MAMRSAATSRICAALLLPPSISAAKKQEARIIGVGYRRGAVWRITTNSCSRILCTRSSWIDSSIKKEESNAVEALALDLAKQAGALILEKSGHALQVGLQPQFSKKKKKKKVLKKFVHFSHFRITTSESRNGKSIL